MGRTSRRRVAVGGLAGVVLLSAAGAAGAQAVTSNLRAGDQPFGDFFSRNRSLDDNPTGFGKPGEYWSIPTGSRISRGAPPRRVATASKPAVSPPAATPPPGAAADRPASTAR